MGKWYIHKVIVDGTDVTSIQIPNNDQWICFFHDGNYAGEGGIEGRKTGKFSMDETTAVLMLDSDQGLADDSNWIVAFAKDTLIMQGLGSFPHEQWHLYAIRSGSFN